MSGVGRLKGGDFIPAVARRLLAGISPRRTGSLGERKAAVYLKKRGYKIEARNFRIRGGEADIIASKNGLLVVVEVKTRTGKSFGAPEAAVTHRKAALAMKAGRIYCRRRGISLSKLRGDVIAIDLDAKGALIDLRHHEGGLALK